MRHVASVFLRQTTGKPKTATYGGRAAIVDGNDGKTYLLQHAGQFDFIEVRRSDFMSASGALGTDSDPHRHASYPGDHDYQMLKDLIGEKI